MWAARGGRTECIEYLIFQGANSEQVLFEHDAFDRVLVYFGVISCNV